MLRRVLTRWFVILFYNPVEIMELMFAILMIAMGTFLMLRPDTFIAGKSYAIMSMVLPEVGWGRIFVMVGLLKLAGVTFKINLARIAGGILTTVSFTFMAGSFLLSNSSSLGTIIFGVLGAFQWWVTLMVLHRLRPNEE